MVLFEVIEIRFSDICKTIIIYNIAVCINAQLIVRERFKQWTALLIFSTFLSLLISFLTAELVLNLGIRIHCNNA